MDDGFCFFFAKRLALNGPPLQIINRPHQMQAQFFLSMGGDVVTKMRTLFRHLKHRFHQTLTRQRTKHLLSSLWKESMLVQSTIRGKILRQCRPNQMLTIFHDTSRTIVMKSRERQWPSINTISIWISKYWVVVLSLPMTTPYSPIPVIFNLAPRVWMNEHIEFPSILHDPPWSGREMLFG